MSHVRNVWNEFIENVQGAESVDPEQKLLCKISFQYIKKDYDFCLSLASNEESAI